jgi:CBS domain containing-hemolysin-like protein
MTSNERDMINNALNLDELLVNEIMTPRTVVQVFDGQESVAHFSRNTRTSPLPVFQFMRSRPKTSLASCDVEIS